MTRRILTDEPEFQTPEGPVWESKTVRPFEVGDRVVVTAGIAECDAIAQEDSYAFSVRSNGHSPELMGQTGVIVLFPQALFDPTHPLTVKFDDGYMLAGCWFPADSFAAAELRLVEAGEGVGE